MPAAKARFVRSHGRDIYYERHGEGPPVLFCHGAGSNAATWWQQLAAFGRQHTCLTVDLRCFGRSVAPLEEFRFELFVDDMLALLDQEGIGRVAVVGQSLGGMVGLRMALWHPQRVAAFVACGTSLAIDHPTLVRSVENRMRAGPAQAIEQRSLGAWFLAQHPDLAQLYSQINHFNPSSLNVPQNDWRATLLTLNAPQALVRTDALRTLGCPVLFVVGSEDPIVPSAVIRELGTIVPGAEVRVFEQAAHSVYFEKPAEFNTAVLDFLARRFR